MAYKYDIFLSYTRGGGARTWVQEIFFPALRDGLDNALPHDSRIFVDWEMDTGIEWPDELERALRHSKVMVSVLSPPYFRSRWCIAEWQSFQARKRHLDGDGRGLLQPAKFADGEHFPDDAKKISYHDFSRWTAPVRGDVFRSTAMYLDFHDEMQRFADTVSRSVQKAPEWDPQWPVVRPDPPENPPLAGIPRL